MRLRVVPGCVFGTLEQGWFRRKALASARQATAAADTVREDALKSPPGPSNDGLSQAIDGVLLELAQTKSLQGARLDAALADSLVHLDVVTGDFAGDSDRQLHSIALACVAELLGDAAERHEVRWQLQADGKHLLIGAIAHAQILALSDAAARHGLSLGSVQPDFCLQWNRHAAALKPGSALFAVASGREVVIAHVWDGSLAAISSGVWLDRQDIPGVAAARVSEMTRGLRVEPTATAGALDTRVDRLLASVGRDAASQSAYLLVAPPLPHGALSSRWTVFNPEPHTL